MLLVVSAAHTIALTVASGILCAADQVVNDAVPKSGEK